MFLYIVTECFSSGAVLTNWIENYYQDFDGKIFDFFSYLKLNMQTEHDVESGIENTKRFP